MTLSSARALWGCALGTSVCHNDSVHFKFQKMKSFLSCEFDASSNVCCSVICSYGSDLGHNL